MKIQSIVITNYKAFLAPTPSRLMATTSSSTVKMSARVFGPDPRNTFVIFRIMLNHIYAQTKKRTNCLSVDHYIWKIPILQHYLV